MSRRALDDIHSLMSKFETDFFEYQQNIRSCYTPKRQRQLRELCVYGYIRRSDIHYNLNLPQEIYPLFWSFYFYPIFKDEWHELKINDRYTEINSSENYIKRLNDASSTDWQYQEGFGKLQISKGDIQEWKINVKQSITQYIHIGIGIWTVDRAVLCLTPLRDRESFLWNGIARHSLRTNSALSNRIDRNDQKYNDSGRQWTRGDIVTVKLDTSGDRYGVLSYRVNEPFEDLGIAWDDLDINETYCLTVWIGNPNTVQLMYDDYEPIWIYP